MNHYPMLYNYAVVSRAESQTEYLHTVIKEGVIEEPQFDDDYAKAKLALHLFVRIDEKGSFLTEFLRIIVLWRTRIRPFL